MMKFIAYILAAIVVFSIIALAAAKIFLRKSLRETLRWLVEFFS